VKVDFIKPKSLGPTNGWTPVVAVRGGKTVYVSGQVSINEKGEAVGAGDLRAQTEQVFKNLGQALAAAGTTFRDVVKSNIYVVGLVSGARWA
jgi:enamine deaminase RidA (YjgF/YER057c/UK114 family)